jgi:hypothetical protein
VTTSGPGTLVFSSINAFPFPAGITTILDVGNADELCRHPAIVPNGGFTVPTFCLSGLDFTSDVLPLGCAQGTAFGNGAVWDAAAPCADADINRHADTSDGSCNPAGQPCNTCDGVSSYPGCTPGSAGAGANTLGNIDSTRGDGVCDPAGMHTRFDIPVRSLTWLDGDATPDCPDEDGVYDPGRDSLVVDFRFILSPTTATTRTEFVDENGDACSFSGAGRSSTRRCSNDHSMPCGFFNDCPAGEEVNCDPGPLIGMPPAGPCCTLGQASTLVATGAIFSGAGPLYDLVFMNRSPTTITACDALGPAEACTLITDPCKD